MEVAKRALPRPPRPPLRDDEAIAGVGEIVQQFAGFGVVDHGADRSRQARSNAPFVAGLDCCLRRGGRAGPCVRD